MRHIRIQTVLYIQGLAGRPPAPSACVEYLCGIRLSGEEKEVGGRESSSLIAASLIVLLSWCLRQVAALIRGGAQPTIFAAGSRYGNLGPDVMALL